TGVQTCALPIYFRNFEGAAAWMLAYGKIAIGAGIAAVVSLDHAAPLRARRFTRSVVARHCVALVFFGAFNDDLGHARNFAHEAFAIQLALFDLLELVLPFACEFGRGELADAQ